MLPGKEYSPADFLEMARRYVWLLVIPPFLGLFCALVYSSKQPDVYESNMLIAVIPQRIPDEFVRSTVTLRIAERLNAIEVQVKSRSVLEPMIAEFDLYQDELERLPMEDVVQMMRGAIRVELETPRQWSQEPQPTAFRVSYTYADAEIAARVTQRLGSIFVDQNVRDRSALAGATDEFLQSQLDDARQLLEEQEARLEDFRKRYGNSLPTQLQSNVQAIQNAQLQIQAHVEGIARNRDRKAMLESLYREAENEPALSADSTVPLEPTTVGDVPQGTARQQLANARAALASLEVRLTPEHPDIVRVKRLIAELEPKAAAEVAASQTPNANDTEIASTPGELARRDRLRQMQAEIDSLDRQTAFRESEEERLQALVAEYQRRIEAAPGIESEWIALTRDYDTQQAAYRSLLSKSGAARVAVDLENHQIGENFRVLDPAGVAARPVSPNRPRISASGLIGGMLLGIALAGLLEFRDASYRSEADVSTVLGLPVLAAVPHVETPSERTRRLRRTGLASAAGVILASGAGYAFWAMELWKVLV
jgi:polysaccharide chain length determinant protein (PEP-CTERM system associated)